MRILIAEDEPDIRKTYKAALENRNHEVIISEDGKQCLDIYEREEQAGMYYGNKSSSFKSTSPSSSSSASSAYSPFDVVILDYKMPKKDGMQAAKEILSLNPQQRIIFASAYVRETLENSIKQLEQVVELIQKPFEVSVLVDTIEDVEASKGLMKIMTKVRQIKDDPASEDELRDIFEGLRKLQKGRISWEL